MGAKGIPIVSKNAPAVPDRFLGHAFCAGDILLELDSDNCILNADGAVSEIGLSAAKAAGTPVATLLSDQQMPTFDGAQSALEYTIRSGPVRLELGLDGGPRRAYAVFFGRLPHAPDRTFLLLADPARFTAVGSAPKVSTAPTDEQTTIFIDRVTGLIEEGTSSDVKRLVTVLETDQDSEAAPDAFDSLQQRLSAISVGGDSVARLGDNKFALVHEQSGSGHSTEELIVGLTQATGLELQAATLNTDSSEISQADSLKAVAYCIQKFAEDAEGFDIESMGDNFSGLIQDTAGKVQQFRSILERGAFSLVFQPIVELRSGHVHHVEALARFEKTSGMSDPFETITFAERVGLIEEFDLAVLQRAVDKLKPALKAEHPPRIAINVSGRSLSSPSFIENFTRTLGQHRNLRDLLMLEITESAEIEDPEAVSDTVDAIRALGFKIYLDDFGAGASGFRYLRVLAVDGVKIDGAYIRTALDNGRTRAFLRSMVMLCQDLGINTVGEWIETAQQAELLDSLGVTYGQGYYFGKPSVGLISSTAGDSASGAKALAKAVNQ